MPKCVECAVEEAKFEDPREVVSGEGERLCRGCAEMIYSDEIADAEEQIRALRRQAEKAGLHL